MGRGLTPVTEEGPQEFRDLLQAFKVLTERLHSAEEARRQLLSNLVHEIGTPLGALNSGIQALRGGADEQAALRQELLAGMEDEIGHLRRLLSDLAHLDDRAAGPLKLNRKEMQVEAWLTKVLATWAAAAQAKALTWESRVASDLPAILGDPDRLAQVLNNLVSNAIKYTKPGGVISVVADRAGDQICISVSDTGVGIPLDEQTLIFNPFFRSRMGKRVSEGMGLGLGIAQDLVHAHGGKLIVESTPGQGSRFTLWLPAMKAEG
jgi:two-component system, OmpR family, sensor histidine kinase BaeS